MRGVGILTVTVWCDLYCVYVWYGRPSEVSKVDGSKNLVGRFGEYVHIFDRSPFGMQLVLLSVLYSVIGGGPRRSGPSSG